MGKKDTKKEGLKIMNSARKRIAWLTTGGTIACAQQEEGLTPQLDAGGLRRHLRACAGMRHGGIRCDHGGLRAAHEEIQVELGQRLRAAHFSGAGHGFRHPPHRVAGLRRCRYEKAA